MSRTRSNEIKFSVNEAELAWLMEKATVNFVAACGQKPEAQSLEHVGRLCMATRQEHCAVDDYFYQEMMEEALSLSPKKRSRWKGKIDDSHGTVHNVVFSNSMLFAKAGCERLIPVVPITVARHVTVDYDELCELDDRCKQPSPRQFRKILQTPRVIRPPPTVPAPVPEPAPAPVSARAPDDRTRDSTFE